MHRSGAVFADIAVICRRKTASRKSFTIESLPPRLAAYEITAKMFADIPLLFAVTGLNNGRIE
jgi:hypothetical protein